MKTTFNKVLQAAVAATVLTFAGASHAADVYDHQALNGYGFTPSSTSSSFFGLNDQKEFDGEFLLSVSVYEMSKVGGGTEKYYAYCIDPYVDFAPKLAYEGSNTAPVSDDVRKLYATSFAASMKDEQSAIAFQLALWDLQKDHGNGMSQGLLSFAPHDNHSAASYAAYVDATVAQADGMLQTAAAYTGSLNGYKYVTFTSADSQTLLGVSAVPEADTWAMMALGLGMLGLVGRRQKKNEKFA